MKRLALIALAVLISAAPALAQAEIDRPAPADSKWMIHFDIRGALDNEFSQLVLEDLRERGIENRIADFTARTGLDPMRDFHGITMYGPTYDEADAVAIMKMVPDTGKLPQMVRLAEGYTVTNYGRYLIHSWLGHKHRTGEQVRKYCGVYVDQQEVNTYLVFGQKLEQVEGGLDLLAGEAKLLAADGKGVMARTPRAGSVLFVVATEVHKAKTRRPSPVLKQADTLYLDMGATDGEVFMEATMAFPEDQQAKNIAMMAQGMLALGRMQQDDPKTAVLARLAQAADVTLDGDAVSMTFEYDAEQLYDELKTLKELKQKRREGAELNLEDDQAKQ